MANVLRAPTTEGIALGTTNAYLTGAVAMAAPPCSPAASASVILIRTA